MNPSSPTPEQVRLKEIYTRFYAFVREVIMPYEPQAFVLHSQFHRALMYTACEPMTATAAPRGMLKSTIFSRYRVLHRLVEPAIANLAPEELILSETTGLSTDHLFWIKNQLSNNLILKDRYGHLTNPSQLTWNEDEIELTNGARCYALGYGSQVRGKHPTGITVDDLESERNVTTDDSLAKLKNWFFRVIMGAMLPETHLTVIGTIIRQKSLLEDLLKTEDFRGRRWKALITNADNTHKSIWPERWPVEYLLKKKRIMGRHRFEIEFQNNPIGPGDTIIDDSWIRRHHHQDLINITPVRRYITVDPAFTEERWGNNSAIIVMDEASNGQLYERLAWKGKLTEPALIRMILQVHYQYQLPGTQLFVGVEKVAGQKGIIQQLNEQSPNLTIIPLIPDKDKVRRLIDVSRYFEMGLVSLQDETFIQEILSFPLGEKDRVDALVYALKLYEQQHPILMDTSTSDWSPAMKFKGDDLTLQLYLERYAEGNPSYQPTPQLLTSYRQAMAIQECLDELW